MLCRHAVSVALAVSAVAVAYAGPPSPVVALSLRSLPSREEGGRIDGLPAVSSDGKHLALFEEDWIGERSSDAVSFVETGREEGEKLVLRTIDDEHPTDPTVSKNIKAANRRLAAGKFHTLPWTGAPAPEPPLKLTVDDVTVRVDDAPPLGPQPDDRVWLVSVSAAGRPPVRRLARELGWTTYRVVGATVVRGDRTLVYVGLHVGQEEGHMRWMVFDLGGAQ